MKISEMAECSALSGSDYFALVKNAAENMKSSLSSMANWIVGTYQHSALGTSSKTIAGALNEINDWKGRLNGLQHPVGSFWMTSTNTNPSAQFGGTWELVDKVYRTQEITDVFTKNATNVTSVSKAVAMLTDRSVHIRIDLTTNVELSDTTVVLGNLKMADIGIVAGGSGVYGVYSVDYSDIGHGVIMSLINNQGEVQSLDVVTKSSGGSIASGSLVNMDFIFTIANKNGMIDSFCDKFYWRRIA